MNTKQKAEAWLAIVENFGRPTGEFQIITALLKEREALLDAVKDSLSGYRYIVETYGDIYGVGSKRVIDKCEKAIALCENKT